MAGTVDIQGCTIDARQLTHIQGGVMQASLFTREGDLNMIFQNNLILMPQDVPLANVFSYFRSTDTLNFRHNAYQTGTSTLHFDFHDGAEVRKLNFSEWQAQGQDVHSKNRTTSGFDLEELRPAPSSLLVDGGADIGPMKDYTGRLFKLRNDIGAFEVPPSTFEHWRVENFTEDELADPGRSGVEGSYSNDGQANLLKYALGLAPGDLGRASLQISVVKSLGTQTILEIVYERSRWCSDVVFQLEISTDLDQWVQAEILQEDILDRTKDLEVVRFRIGSSLRDTSFVRLKVIQNGVLP